MARGASSEVHCSWTQFTYMCVNGSDSSCSLAYFTPPSHHAVPTTPCRAFCFPLECSYSPRPSKQTILHSFGIQHDHQIVL